LLQNTVVNERAARFGEQARAGCVSIDMTRKLLRGIGVASILAGVVAVCFVASPEILSTLSTAHLIGIFVLVVGPAMTKLAIRLERRMSEHVTRELTEESVERSLRIAKHGAHGRSRKLHTRAEERPETVVRSHEHAA
jgi:hypothetical protein